MGIKTDFAFNMVDKQNRILDYYFYFNAAFKALRAKNFLGKDFFKTLTDKFNQTYANKGNMQFHRSYMYTDDLTPHNIHDAIKGYNHQVSTYDRTKVIANLFNSAKGIDMFVAEHFYDKIVNNFYTKNSKFKLFSIFKSKDVNDKNYYMLIGNAKLEKCLNYESNNFIDICNNINNLKYMPIGDYFIMVRFSPAKNFIREHAGKHYDKNVVKPFPTNLIKVQYFLTDADIEKKFEQVNVDFEYI